MSLKTSINRLGAVAVMALSVLALVTPTASPAGATHGNRAFIYALWNDFVGDDPDSATLAYWENRLDNALSTRSQVVNSLLTSASFQDDYIYQVYQLYTDRYPDDTQYAAATTATSGGDFVEVELAVLSGAEYSDDDAVADVDYVAKVFNDVLHRSPGAGESSYWTGQLAVDAQDRGPPHRAVVRVCGEPCRRPRAVAVCCDPADVVLRRHGWLVLPDPQAVGQRR